MATKTKRNNGARNEQRGEVLELIAEAQRLRKTLGCRLPTLT